MCIRKKNSIKIRLVCVRKGRWHCNWTLYIREAKLIITENHAIKWTVLNLTPYKSGHNDLSLGSRDLSK